MTWVVIFLRGTVSGQLVAISIYICEDKLESPFCLWKVSYQVHANSFRRNSNYFLLLHGKGFGVVLGVFLTNLAGFTVLQCQLKWMANNTTS